MVGVSGDAALGAEGKHYLRAKVAHMPGQVTNDVVSFLAVELAIGIIQHNSLRDF